MSGQKRKRKLSVGLQWKAILLLTFIVINVAVIGGWFYFNAARDVLRGGDLERAARMSDSLGVAARQALNDGDRSTLISLTRDVIGNDRLQYVALLDAEGKVMGEARRDGGTWAGLVNLPVSVSSTRQVTDDVLVLARPVVMGSIPGRPDRLVGAMRLVMDTRVTTAKISRVQHRMSMIAVAVVLCAVPLAYVLVWRTLVKPVGRLAYAARRLGEGDFSARSGIHANDEIGELAYAFDTMAGDVTAMRDELVRTNALLEHKVAERTEQLQDSMSKMKTMAETDHLTGLANRRRFGELLDRYFSEASRYGFDLTCCMCDLDHYKELNDTLGHQCGDEVLVISANVIREALRSSDIAARYGGDEFVLLLPHTSVDRGTSVAQRIRQEMITAANISGHVRPVTMSIGIASIGANGADSADALVSMADRALYEAKARGKDQIVQFDVADRGAPKL